MKKIFQTKKKIEQINKNLLKNLQNQFNSTLNNLSNNLINNTNNKLNKLNKKITNIHSKISSIKLNNNNKIINKLNKSNSIISEKLKLNNNEKYNFFNDIQFYINNENYEQAFLKVLNNKDDLLLIRLLFITKKEWLKNISIQTNKKIILRINNIFRSFMIQNQIIFLFEEYFKLNLFNLNVFQDFELNDIMQTLYEIGNNYENNLNEQAQILYENIKNNFNNNKE